MKSMEGREGAILNERKNVSVLKFLISQRVVIPIFVFISQCVVFLAELFISTKIAPGSAGMESTNSQSK